MSDTKLESAMAIPGHMADVEVQWLTTQASQLPPGGIWVEVGVFCGRSLMAVALGMPLNGTLLAVDLRLGLDSIDGLGFLETYRKILELRPDLSIIGMKMPSEAAAVYVPDGTVQGLFIDADHSYESVNRDIRAWLPKLQAGGLLCGHDFHESHWPGVVKAVRELLPSASEPDVGSIWTFRVPS